MIPFLANSYPFIGNGLGGLSDAIECKVTHEINGEYELSMRYPITGIHYDEIAPTYIIMAVPDNMTQAQPFRIYRISKPLNGVVTVYARHIAYDMMGTIVEPFTQPSLTAAITDLENHCTPSPAFSFGTTRTVASQFKLSEPRELWRVLGGSAGSFLDVYGGEWDFDRLSVTLKTRLGADRGVHIRYGKNMTGLEQDASLESTYSGVWPFWYDEESGTLVQISEKFVAVPGASVTDRVLLLDCTDDFENQPSEQDLRDRANNYITANSVGDPKTSWRVSFVQLSQAGEAQAALEQVMLGDTLHVYYEALGVNATARAVKTVYDVLADHYKEVTVGRVKQNLANIIVDQNKETENKIATTKSALEQAIDRSTDFIKNGGGYMRFIYNSSNELVEIVSLDNPDIAQATNVWRWNNGGFGFSNTGYNGTYGLAITQAGEIVADYITAGTLTANVIRAGLLTDTLGNNSWDLDTGTFTIKNGTINISTNNQTASLISLSWASGSNKGESTITPSGYSLWDYDSGILNRTSQITLNNGYITAEYRSGTNPGTLQGRASMSGVEGFKLLDGNQNDRAALGLTGLTFYNSSGTQTATYPAAGLSETQGTAIVANVASGTDTKVASVTLDAGKWVIFAFVGFDNNSTGSRFISITSSSSSATTGVVASDSRNPATGRATRIAIVGYAKPTAQTTYYLWAAQYSGGTLSLSPLSMYAIKLP